MITYELLKAKEVKQLRNYNDLRRNFFLILDSEETKLKTSLAKCVFTFVSSLMLHGEDRPNTTPIGQRPLSFALTRTSFTDLPFLHEIRGGCLNIFRSEGRFCIRCHLFIRICLRSGIDGRYSVTNGNILSRVFCLFCRADILWLKLTSGRVMFKRLSG